MTDMNHHIFLIISRIKQHQCFVWSVIDISCYNKLQLKWCELLFMEVMFFFGIALYLHLFVNNITEKMRQCIRMHFQDSLDKI